MKPTYSLNGSVTDSLQTRCSSSGVDTVNEYVKYMLTTGADATCANLIIEGVGWLFHYLIVYF